MLFQLLTEASESVSESATPSSPNYGTLILLGIMVIAFIGFSIYNNRAQKKRAAEAQKQLDAVKPGTKVKTIGGICGVVVETSEDTIVLETGSKDKKSYVTFDKRAIAESDAVVVEEKKEEKPKKAKKAKKEEAVEEPAEEKAEENTEEANDKE